MMKLLVPAILALAALANAQDFKLDYKADWRNLKVEYSGRLLDTTNRPLDKGGWKSENLKYSIQGIPNVWGFYTSTQDTYGLGFMQKGKNFEFQVNYSSVKNMDTISLSLSTKFK